MGGLVIIIECETSEILRNNGSCRLYVRESAVNPHAKVCDYHHSFKYSDAS